ncbi:MAG: NUDIX hydrolase [Thermoplasmata archaeon]
MSGGAPSTSPGRPARSSIADLLGRFPVLDPPVAIAGAAVTVVLREGVADAEVLLIERSRSPTDPASGEVALPGGRVDETDGNLRVTALRELAEEVGLSEGDLAGPLRFVGTRPAPRFGLEVAVFAAELSPAGRAPTAFNAREVAHVFWFPRNCLDPPEAVRTVTRRGPLEVPASRFEGHLLWGFTRRVVRDFFGLPPENDVGGPIFAPTPAEARGSAGTSVPAPAGDLDRP